MKTFFEFSEVATAPRNLSGIYAIYGKHNDFHYVGQTQDLNGFCGRWKKHRSILRGGYHDNPYLQASYNKNGERSFSFKILQSVSGDYNLNILESNWIDKLESRHFQNGWNIAEITSSGSVKPITSETSRIKFFQVITPKGNLISGRNMNQFSRDNNLEPSCFSRLIAVISLIIKDLNQ